MSLFKRKSSSLDPIQKQKKFKQTQYYVLLDKCTQIPNDDKIILRRGIVQYEQYLISLLEKYRKQGIKDLKELQIFLRKYIQKYKNQHPKYPILKLTKENQQSNSLPKRRDSMTISINASKINSRASEQFKGLVSTSSKSKSNQKNQNLKSLKLSLNKKSKINLSYCKQPQPQQKNYEKIIQQRKNNSHFNLNLNQKRKQNKVSLKLSKTLQTLQSSIKNQQNNSFNNYSNFKDYSIIQNNKFEIKNCSNNNNKKQAIYIQSDQSLNQNNQHEIQNQKLVIDVNLSNIDLLQTMRFRMKRDQVQHQIKEVQRNQDAFKYANQFQKTIRNQQLTHFSMQSYKQQFPNIQVSNQIQPLQLILNQNNSIKRNLFDSHRFSSNQTQKSIQNEQNNMNFSKKRISLSQMNMNKLQQQNNLRNSLNYNKNYSNRKSYSQLLMIQTQNSQKHYNPQKRKNIIDDCQKQNTISNMSIVQSINEIQNNIDKKNNYSISQISQLNSVRNIPSSNITSQQQNSFNIYYLNSQRKKSNLLSHRLTQTNNCLNLSNIKQSSRNKDSNRMIFSHRMQEVISGRKEKLSENQITENDFPSVRFQNSSLEKSYMKKEKKSAGKLQFWNRIQETINT